MRTLLLQVAALASAIAFGATFGLRWALAATCVCCLVLSFAFTDGAK